MTDGLTTGVDGLDEGLFGGLVPGRSYMIAGRPAAGPGIHFLIAGADAGQNYLYVDLEETVSDIPAFARPVGLALDGRLRKAIGVRKKRTGDLEWTLRAFESTPHGITVGGSLAGLGGILEGNPGFAHASDPGSSG